MTVCDVSFIRTIGNISSDLANDTQVKTYRDTVSLPTLVDDINYGVDDEHVLFVSGEKENRINGDNTVYYLEDLHKNHNWLGDRNSDGVVDEKDLDIYVIDSNDDRVTDLQVTVLDPSIGKLEVLDGSGNPLQGVDLYVSYDVAPLDEESPHPLYKLACAQLTCAYMYTSIEAPKLEKYDIGDVSVSEQSGAEQDFWQAYEETKRRMSRRDVYSFEDNVNFVENVFKGPRF